MSRFRSRDQQCAGIGLLSVTVAHADTIGFEDLPVFDFAPVTRGTSPSFGTTTSSIPFPATTAAMLLHVGTRAGPSGRRQTSCDSRLPQPDPGSGRARAGVVPQAWLAPESRPLGLQQRRTPTLRNGKAWNERQRTARVLGSRYATCRSPLRGWGHQKCPPDLAARNQWSCDPTFCWSEQETGQLDFGLFLAPLRLRCWNQLCQVQSHQFHRA